MLNEDFMDCTHEGVVYVCPKCDNEFCYDCCIGTNIDVNERESKYIICPNCGRNYYNHKGDV